MSRVNNESNVTTVELEFPLDGEPLEYKYVVMSGGQTKLWESCENRVVSQSQSGSSFACFNILLEEINLIVKSLIKNNH